MVVFNHQNEIIGWHLEEVLYVLLCIPKLSSTITLSYNLAQSLKLKICCYINLLSSRLLSKNIKFRMYKTIILPVVLCGCDTWSLTLRKQRILRVFEKRDRREMK
jgi:hypothetical protein